QEHGAPQAKCGPQDQDYGARGPGPRPGLPRRRHKNRRAQGAAVRRSDEEVPGQFRASGDPNAAQGRTRRRGQDSQVSSRRPRQPQEGRERSV
ncbi:hypothetical protein OC844_007688, partial [Tilletia horrida]